MSCRSDASLRFRSFAVKRSRDDTFKTLSPYAVITPVSHKPTLDHRDVLAFVSLCCPCVAVHGVVSCTENYSHITVAFALHYGPYRCYYSPKNKSTPRLVRVTSSEVQWFQNNYSQALTKSKELSAYTALGSSSGSRNFRKLFRCLL